MKLINPYKPEVEQIYYSYYGQEGSSLKYFSTIHNIAEFIGNALENRNYTIRVHQAKEKFGEVRVYCSLADVSDEEFNKNEKLTRIIEDSKWYRLMYLSAINLFPQYYKAIVNAADYPHLLCYNKEELDKVIERDAINEIDEDK